MVYEKHRTKRIEEHIIVLSKNIFRARALCLALCWLLRGVQRTLPPASSGSSQLDGKEEHRSLWNTLEVSLKWVRAWGSGVQR